MFKKSCFSSRYKVIEPSTYCLQPNFNMIHSLTCYYPSSRYYSQSFIHFDKITRSNHDSPIRNQVRRISVISSSNDQINSMKTDQNNSLNTDLTRQSVSSNNEPKDRLSNMIKANIIPQSYNEIKQMSSSTDDILEKKIALFHAYIRSENLINAELLLNKLYKLNYGNMKKHHDIHPFNALIEAFLRIDLLFDSKKPDLSKALSIYESISKHDLTPNLNTFSIFSFYLMNHSDITTMKIILEDMSDQYINYSLLFENYLFQNPIDSSKLVQFLRQCDIDASNTSTTDFLLESAIDEYASPTNSDTNHKESTLFNESELEKIVSTPSDSVQLLLDSMKKFSNSTSETDKYKLQEILEKESQNFALLDRQGKQNLLPSHLQLFCGNINTTIKEWCAKMIPFIENDLKENKIKPYTSFMKLLQPKQLALITVCKFLEIPSSTQINSGEVLGQTKFVLIASQIGRAIQEELNANLLSKKKHSNTFNRKRLYELHRRGQLTNVLLRNKALDDARSEINKNTPWNPQWPEHCLIEAGSLLAGLLIQSAKIEYNDPVSQEPKETDAFIHTYIHEDNKKIGLVVFNKELLSKLLDIESVIPPKFLPMIVPPRPWTSWTSGGYLTEYNKTDMVRTTRSKHHKTYLDAADEGDHLKSLYHAMDCLGSTAWKINTKVLDIIKICWNSKDPWPSIPSGHPLAKLPALSPKEKSDIKAVYANRKDIQQNSNKEKSRYSQRCDTNYKIIIAEAFRDQVIYFPHSLDFRGRAYPIPNYLNHIGSDLCRGLLLFDIEKPLGVRGLQWLKIHLANLYGVDKISFSDREKFVEEHVNDIYDSADRPLDGKMWWKQADSPWQCLASCIELAAALRCPDPTLYLSRLPVHQDGTCNGLQHYAAIGGDIVGAKLVNLTPGDRPSDVYSNVAISVAESIKKDAIKGDQLAKNLQGFISRKVVKQTVMTNTYGVTRIGAKVQVFARLNDIPDLNMTEPERFKAAGYISTKIFDALETKFHVAKLISKSVHVDQLTEKHLSETKWAIENGLLDQQTIKAEPLKPEPVQQIDNDEILLAAIEETEENTIDEDQSPQNELIIKDSSVVWTTPLGLPVVQPYWNYESKSIKTHLQRVTIQDTKSPCPVHAQKQSTAFPPNFIHSLDASHMMMSAIDCTNKKITFASVHDSYWTHATSIDSMNEIIRDSFIQLHSEDLMKRLRDEIIERYKNHYFLQTIPLTRHDYLRYLEHIHKPKSKKMAKECCITVWVPLFFPDVPDKGDFDIECVRKSPYFFH